MLDLLFFLKCHLGDRAVIILCAYRVLLAYLIISGSPNWFCNLGCFVLQQVLLFLVNHAIFNCLKSYCLFTATGASKDSKEKDCVVHTIEKPIVIQKWFGGKDIKGREKDKKKLKLGQMLKGSTHLDAYYLFILFQMNCMLPFY